MCTIWESMGSGKGRVGAKSHGVCGEGGREYNNTISSSNSNHNGYHTSGLLTGKYQVVIKKMF